MPKDFGRRLPIDTRMISEIRRSPSMSADQGSGWLSDWGGSAGYSFWASRPLPERVVYFAVSEGYSTQKDIADVTDLRTGEVSSALTALEKQGLVSPGQVTK